METKGTKYSYFDFLYPKLSEKQIGKLETKGTKCSYFNCIRRCMLLEYNT